MILHTVYHKLPKIIKKWVSYRMSGHRGCRGPLNNLYVLESGMGSGWLSHKIIVGIHWTYVVHETLRVKVKRYGCNITGPPFHLQTYETKRTEGVSCIIQTLYNIHPSSMNDQLNKSFIPHNEIRKVGEFKLSVNNVDPLLNSPITL